MLSEKLRGFSTPVFETSDNRLVVVARASRVLDRGTVIEKNLE